MSTPPLSTQLTTDALSHLGIMRELPSLDYLDRLIGSYIRCVPWESVFRIVKRARTAHTAECPRWPEEFWWDAMARGGGGTCFESNYAFFRLLRALGFKGYLTVNNMRDTGEDPNPSIGCHSAILIQIEGQHWLVDVGLPIHAALPIDPEQITERGSEFFDYAVYPDGPNRYQIQRSPHPAPNCYTLIDKRIRDAEYRLRLTDDYGENGLFLNKVIITKIVDGRIWRFNSVDNPLHMEEFVDGERIDYPLVGKIAEKLSRKFAMDASMIREALNCIGIV